jgi:hypothetical protein
MINNNVKNSSAKRNLCAENIIRENTPLTQTNPKSQQNPIF